MKKLLFVLLFGFALTSCDTTVKTKQDSTQTWCGKPIQVVEYDNCEYVYFSNGNMSWGAHKGNCKYCAERNEK